MALLEQDVLVNDEAEIVEAATTPNLGTDPMESGQPGGLELGAPGLPQLTSDEFYGIMGTGASGWFSQLLRGQDPDIDDSLLIPGGDVEGARGRVLDLAYGALGVPYVWGGNSLTAGVDCSGFVQQVYKRLGVNLPRVSNDQANSGQRISLNQLRPGDLVAWDNSSRNNGADHIAIYIGNGKVIDAPNPGETVRIANLWDTGRAWGVRVLGD